MHFLLTGGSCCISHNLVNRLIDDGHKVTITATSGENFNPKVYNTLLLGLTGVDNDTADQYDCVFHLAANNDTLFQDYEALHWVNALSPREFFETLEYHGQCTNFVYASSTAVYGDEPAPYVEDVTRLNPLNPYALSKEALEEEMKIFVEDTHVKAIGLRFCNVYGPGEGHKGRRMSMIGQMLRNKAARQSTKLFAPGDQKRDWVYVDDVVNACVLAMNKLISRGKSKYHNIFNVGSGTSKTFNDLAMAIYGHHNVEYVDCPFEDTYQSYTECNLEKINSLLGYEPQYHPYTGINEYMDKEKTLSF